MGNRSRAACLAAAWGAALGPQAAAAGAGEGPKVTSTGLAWTWQESTYLGHWKAGLRWPELARCWQRYGGDAMPIAPAPPSGQGARLLELRAFPRHADFDRKSLKARRAGPYPEQLAALDLLATQGAAVAERVLDSVHAYFLDHDLDAVAGEVWNSEGQANIDRLKRRETIGETVELKAIHVHNKWRDGVSYVGLIFETQWDDGHGLGVLLHGTRIVQVGGADTAFNPSQWADGDLEEPAQPWLR